MLCGALSQKKNLEFLDLSGDDNEDREEMNEESCRHIKGMLKDTASIQTLILHECTIRDHVTFIMEGLTLNHTLLYLNLSIYTLFILDCCKIKAVGWKCIGEYLGTNRQLQKLEMSNLYIYTYIDHNRIKDEGWVGHIGEGLSQNNTLLHLDLSRNHIYWEGAEKLTKGLIKNNTLVTLDLGIYI